MCESLADWHPSLGLGDAQRALPRWRLHPGSQWVLAHPVMAERRGQKLDPLCSKVGQHGAARRAQSPLEEAGLSLQPHLHWARPSPPQSREPGLGRPTYWVGTAEKALGDGMASWPEQALPAGHLHLLIPGPSSRQSSPCVRVDWVAQCHGHPKSLMHSEPVARTVFGNRVFQTPPRSDAVLLDPMASVLTKGDLATEARTRRRSPGDNRAMQGLPLGEEAVTRKCGQPGSGGRTLTSRKPFAAT